MGDRTARRVSVGSSVPRKAQEEGNRRVQGAKQLLVCSARGSQALPFARLHRQQQHMRDANVR